MVPGTVLPGAEPPGIPGVAVVRRLDAPAEACCRAVVAVRSLDASAAERHQDAAGAGHLAAAAVERRRDGVGVEHPAAPGVEPPQAAAGVPRSDAPAEAERCRAVPMMELRPSPTDVASTGRSRSVTDRRAPLEVCRRIRGSRARHP